MLHSRGAMKKQQLVNQPPHVNLQTKLDEKLNQLLKQTNDEFLPGPDLIKRCGYVVNPTNGTVDYKIPFNPANITKSLTRV